jgi:predicted nucleotidyltransferase
MDAKESIKRITNAIAGAVPAEKIYLFGSYAYGVPNKNSDFDFYVIIPENSMRPIEAMRQSQRALCVLEPDAPPIDVVASTQSKFDIMSNRINTIEKEIAQKGVLLYERQH